MKRQKAIQLGQQYLALVTGVLFWLPPVELHAAVPPAPTGVSASDGTYYDKIRITWNRVAEATGYEVRRYPRNEVLNAIPIGSTTTNSYDDTTMSPLLTYLTYYYWVYATNSNGRSPASASNSGYVNRLPKPLGVRANDGQNASALEIHWDPVVSATGYEVWRNTSDVSSTASRIGISRLSEFFDQDISLIPGTNYFYWIKATNLIQTSDFSVSDVGFLQIPLPIAVLTGIRKNADGSRTITWDGAATVQFAPSVLGPWQDIPQATSPYTYRKSSSATFIRLRQ
jgi:hypothetical protein